MSENGFCAYRQYMSALRAMTDKVANAKYASAPPAAMLLAALPLALARRVWAQRAGVSLGLTKTKCTQLNSAISLYVRMPVYSNTLLLRCMVSGPRGRTGENGGGLADPPLPTGVACVSAVPRKTCPGCSFSQGLAQRAAALPPAAVRRPPRQPHARRRKLQLAPRGKGGKGGLVLIVANLTAPRDRAIVQQCRCPPHSGVILCGTHSQPPPLRHCTPPCMGTASAAHG